MLLPTDFHPVARPTSAPFPYLFPTDLRPVSRPPPNRFPPRPHAVPDRFPARSVGDPRLHPPSRLRGAPAVSPRCSRAVPARSPRCFCALLGLLRGGGRVWDPGVRPHYPRRTRKPETTKQGLILRFRLQTSAAKLPQTAYRVSGVGYRQDSEAGPPWSHTRPPPSNPRKP